MLKKHLKKREKKNNTTTKIVSPETGPCYFPAARLKPVHNLQQIFLLLSSYSFFHK